MATFEEQKKALLPLLKRAEEVEKSMPKIAYYLRLHAADQAIAIGSKNLHPDIKALLMSIMDKLDKTRDKVGLNKEGDPAYCEEFALGVFDRADKADRAGKSDKATVATFLASTYFLDMLNQFGPVRPEIQEKQKYAAYRAAFISKALNEGRVPDRPPGDTSSRPISEHDDAELLAELDGMTPPPPSSSTINTVPGGGASVGDALGLPDVPSTTSAPLPPPAAPPAAGSGPKLERRETRHFEKHQKVRYRDPQNGALVPLEGSVIKIELGPRGQEIYHVQLAKNKTIVKTETYNLAPLVSVGDQVVEFLSDGTPVDVTVEEIYDSKWPPSYMVQRPNGCLDTIEDEVMAIPLEDAPAPPAGLGSAPPPAVAPPPPPPVAPAPPAPPVIKPVPPPVAPTQPPPAPQPPQPPAVTVQPAAPSAPPPPQPQQPAVEVVPPAVPVAAAAPVIPQAAPGFQPPLPAMMEAEKLAKTAASSISFDDVPTAVKYLTDALKLLTQGKK